MHQHLFIHHQFTTEIITKQRLDNIIRRRSQATRYNNNISLAAFFIQGPPDIVIHIADSHPSFDPNPDFIQFLADKSAVGINGLADKQFIADRDDRSINNMHRF